MFPDLKLKKEYNTMQTITVKWLSATSTRGARIRATTTGGTSIIRPYDYALNAEENIRLVAQKLYTRMQWGEDGMTGGDNKDGSMTFVSINSTSPRIS